MPAPRDLDASASPLAFFGAELRIARLAAGLSQEQLGKRLGFSGDLVGKIETGERRPKPEFVAACDEAFPAANGLFGRIYDLARRSGGAPAWFQEWYEAEREAASVSCWQPWLVPGLAQTPDYARALFHAWRSADNGDELDQLVSARMARQCILDRPKPRCCGSSSTRPCCTGASALPRSPATNWTIWRTWPSGPGSPFR